MSELTDGTDVSPSVRMSGAVDTLVPPEIAPHAEAALREGLSNALRHARAKHIVVTIEAARTSSSTCSTTVPIRPRP